MKFTPTYDEAGSAFHLRQGASGKRAIELVVQPVGSRLAPVSIWSRRFDTADDRAAMLDAVKGGTLDPLFLGRLTMIFGSAALDDLAGRLIEDAHAAHARTLAEAEGRARDRLIVQLYRREDKHGRHILELQRKSSNEAEWSVTYDRAIERDRLCDWLRWQKDRFLGFLDYAATHGSEALSRMLIDEMFLVERRVKKEGRGAGGMRPLRMWRGD